MESQSGLNDLLAADLAELGRQIPADLLAPLVRITLQFLVDMKVCDPCSYHLKHNCKDLGFIFALLAVSETVN
jgi:hypothetical protein